MNLLIIAGVIGPLQLVLSVIFVFLLFNGRKIPEMMNELGQGMHEFMKATRENPEEKIKGQYKTEC